MAYSALGGNTAHNASDPYNTEKSNVVILINKFTSDFDVWHDILEQSNTHQNERFKELTDSLKSQYKQINRCLKDMSKSIETIESNRSNFAWLSNQELVDRNVFLKDMKSVITEHRQKMQSDRTRKKLELHKTQFEATQKTETTQHRLSRINNEESMSKHKHVQSDEMKEQDNILDDMHLTLKRLGVHGQTISIEIDAQNKLLDDVDEEMSITQDRLTRLTTKLDNLMGNSNKKKLFLIVLLVVILFVLIYFITSK